MSIDELKSGESGGGACCADGDNIASRQRKPTPSTLTHVAIAAPNRSSVFDFRYELLLVMDVMFGACASSVLYILQLVNRVSQWPCIKR